MGGAVCSPKRPQRRGRGQALSEDIPIRQGHENSFSPWQSLTPGCREDGRGHTATGPMYEHYHHRDRNASDRDVYPLKKFFTTKKTFSFRSLNLL
jgi:hypothetical protein